MYRHKTTFDVPLFKRQVTDLAAVFLHGAAEKYDFEDTVFLVSYFGCQTFVVRSGLSGRVGYTDRNLSEKWFHTLKMQGNRFHNSGAGSRLSVCQWFVLLAHFYNVQRPHQALDGRTPPEEVN